jgi:hypothetical protein
MSLSPEITAARIIAWVSAGAALVGPFVWWVHSIARHAPADPWPEEIDHAVRAREAVPLCVNCLCSQDDHPWFCPHCGYPAGEYVTMMPYLQIFAVGEVFRRGVIGPPEKGFALKAFFVLYSISELSVFAPIYWFWMVRKARGKPICQARKVDLEFTEVA